MNSEQIWQQACKIIGITDAPPLGEPASAMKMLELFLRTINQIDGLPYEMEYAPEAYPDLPYIITRAGQSSYHGASLPDALAAAVVATQEQSR